MLQLSDFDTQTRIIIFTLFRFPVHSTHGYSFDLNRGFVRDAEDGRPKLHDDQVELLPIEQFSLSTPGEQRIYYLLMDGCLLSIRFSYSLILCPLITYKCEYFKIKKKRYFLIYRCVLIAFHFSWTFVERLLSFGRSFIADAYRSRKRYSNSTELAFFVFQTVFKFLLIAFNQFYSSSVTHLCWENITRTSLRLFLASFADRIS